MKIILVGGGSGGHITPLLAVAHELKKQAPGVSVDYILEKGSKFAGLPAKSPDIDAVYSIRAGKFRRYHSQSLLAHIVDVPTNLKNIRDSFYAAAGFSKSLRLLRRLKPDAVFIKGGFVGVPVGFACARLGIPYFTHDSDTVPGLANKLIAKHAKFHAVGMPAEFYSYPKEKLRYSGIPMQANYEKVTNAQQLAFKNELDLPEDSLVVCVTGGSLGAQRLNQSFGKVAQELLLKFPNLYILHQTGQSSDDTYKNLPLELSKRVQQKPYFDDLYRYTGAADVVITRAGATTIAELAVQAKACIVVPNPQLTGGQQTKNAQHLAKYKAVLVVAEEQAKNSEYFSSVISGLLLNKGERNGLEEAIHGLAKKDAASELASLALEVAQYKRVN